jgi:hypothetical protein
VGGKLNVYNLGALGVNLVSGHIHMKDGELLQCQNAMASPIGAQVALVKRPGMEFLSTTGAKVFNLKSFLMKSYTEQVGVSGTTWLDVKYSSALGRFVAVTFSGTNRIITSDDGITWTPNNGQALNLNWLSLAHSPSLGLFAAVANGGAGGTAKVMTSPDGLTWTIRNFATSNVDWSGIAWSPTLSLFAAVSESGTIPLPLNTSPDGITWTSRTGVGGGWRRIIWADGPAIFLKMGWTTGGFSQFGTSANGILWTLRPTTIPTTLFNDAVWVSSLNLIVAVGNFGAGDHIATSPDGITWTSRTISGNPDLWSIEYASELGLLVAQGSFSYYLSQNGIDWWQGPGTSLNPSRGSDLVWVNSLERFGVVGSNGAGYLALE